MTFLEILLILILAPVLGCIMSGIDRKISARLQHRVGPPLLQPLYDFLKLLSKENIATNKYQNIYPLIYLVFVAGSLVMLILQADLLAIIFVFTIGNVAFITGAMATGSPYGKIGAQREIMAMLAYEPVLIFYIVGMYMLTGSFKISGISSTGKPLLMYMPLIFLAMVFIMGIKFKKSPFDYSTSHHGHQELVKGLTTEYSGPGLAIIELTHWYEAVFLTGLMFIFWKQNVILGLLLGSLTFLFVIILDNISARITWQWMLRFTWTIVVVLSVVNILGIYFLNLKVI